MGEHVEMYFIIHPASAMPLISQQYLVMHHEKNWHEAFIIMEIRIQVRVKL